MSILPFWILSIQSEERPSPADSASLIYLSYACCCNEIFSVTFESSEDNASLRFDHVRYVLEAVVSNSLILRLIRSNFVSIQSRVSFVSSLSFEESDEGLELSAVLQLYLCPHQLCQAHSVHLSCLQLFDTLATGQ